MLMTSYISLLHHVWNVSSYNRLFINNCNRFGCGQGSHEKCLVQDLSLCSATLTVTHSIPSQKGRGGQSEFDR